MNAPFTPAQEARIREMLNAAVEMAVACGAGDTPRLLIKLDFMRISSGIDQQHDRQELLFLAAQARDDSNATRGIRSNEAAEYR